MPCHKQKDKLPEVLTLEGVKKQQKYALARQTSVERTPKNDQIKKQLTCCYQNFGLSRQKQEQKRWKGCVEATRGTNIFCNHKNTIAYIGPSYSQSTIFPSVLRALLFTFPWEKIISKSSTVQILFIQIQCRVASGSRTRPNLPALQGQGSTCTHGLLPVSVWDDYSKYQPHPAQPF